VKIIHVITRLEAGGSSQNVILNAANQALKADVIIAAGPFPGALETPRTARSIELSSLKRELSLVSDAKAFLELLNLFLNERPDIIHTHTSKAGFLGRLAAAVYNLRTLKRTLVIHTPHGHVLYGYFSPFKTLIFKLAERLAALCTDHFIALTSGELKESVAAGFGNREKWSIAHSGINFPEAEPDRLKARKELGVSADEILTGVIARLEPVKGVEWLLRAAALADRKHSGREGKLRFLVVGDGQLMAGLRALALELGIADKVIFAGFRKDVFNCLSAMDIYVQPSLNEAMGRTVLEAQHAGLPIVASRVCGLPDAVLEGASALLVRPADADALAEAITELAYDKEKRRTMGAAGRCWAAGKDEAGHGRFSPEAMNAAIENIYNKAMVDLRG
jgi:glycosyltransferase involved in cell wall biosynthesis